MPETHEFSAFQDGGHAYFKDYLNTSIAGVILQVVFNGRDILADMKFSMEM